MSLLIRIKILSVIYLALTLCVVNLCSAAETGEDKGAYRVLPVTLRGLEGEQLMLKLNGSEILQLAKDGPYSFRTSLAAGAEYSVELIEQPLNHLCELKDNTGVFDPAMKGGVEIQCRLTGKWLHPQSLTDSLSLADSDVLTTAAAMDGKGNGIVAWSQPDSGNVRIYLAEYRQGQWQKPAGRDEAISLKEGNAKEPRVAIAANGDAVIVWEQLFENESFIFMAEKRGGKWQKPVSRADHISPGNSYAWEPEAAMDDLGNTVIVWSQEYTDGFHNIYISEYREGQWTHPSLEDYINPRGGDGLRPEAAMNNRNEALIAWEQDPGGLSRIYKSEFRNGIWSHPADIDDHINPKEDNSNIAHHAKPAINDMGETIIAWEQAHGASNRIYLSEYRQGKWKHPESIDDAISPGNGFAASLNDDVAMDNKGNCIILWRLQVKANQALYMSEYRNGAWNHPLEDDFIAGGRRPFEFRTLGSAALSDSGKAVVAWLQMGDDGISRSLYAEHENGSWRFPGKPFTVNDQAAAVVNVAGSDNGSFIMSWLQMNSSGKVQVYASVFSRIEAK